MRCRKAPVARQVRPIFPVFQCISGATKTTWRSSCWPWLFDEIFIDIPLNSFAAVRTVVKIPIQRPFAIRTGFIIIPGLTCKIRAKFRNRLFTAITHDERITFFNSQERDKKETEVVIHPLIISLVQTANRAPPRVLVQYLRFRRYAGDKDHSV